MIEDNELACFEATSAHEEPKPIDGEAARQGNQMAKRPYNRRTRGTIMFFIYNYVFQINFKDSQLSNFFSLC